SGFVILAINSIFSAATCVTIYRIGEQTLGRATAIISAWTWAALPYAIYWPTHHVWETSLSAFLLTAALLLTLQLTRTPGWGVWISYGLLWGLIALTNAALLSFLGVSILWLLAREHSARMALISRSIVAVVSSLLVVSPWIIRNYHVFGQFVFP